MANDPIINEQELIDAKTDVDTLEEFVNQNKIVTSRLGTTYNSLKKMEGELNNSLTQGLLPVTLHRNNYTAEAPLLNEFFETDPGLFKPMYRRTVLFNAVNLGNNISPMGINGTYFEPLSVRLTGIMNLPGSSTYVHLPWFNYNQTQFCNLACTGQDVQLWTNYDWSSHKAWVTVTYAKTTDTGHVGTPVGIAGPKGDPLTKTFDPLNHQEALLENQFWQTSVSGKKPMYHKCFDIPVLPDTDTLNISHGLTLSSLVPGSVQIRGNAGTDTSVISLNNVPTTDPTTAVRMAIGGSNIVIQTYSDRSAYHGFVEIIYAKTADSEV